jgi:hypothetical protein
MHPFMQGFRPLCALYPLSEIRDVPQTFWLACPESRQSAWESGTAAGIRRLKLGELAPPQGHCRKADRRHPDPG